ncbi:hypothetical protein [Chitinophaga defluvii]|uniref:Uncharacterized protein n=1 Tax=Chitinophaga defluvii TaxID=3163343 RepID=A0ABV2T467_9BACT
MRHITTSTHNKFCDKLKSLSVEPDLVNNQIIRDTQIKDQLDEDRERLEMLHFNYQQHLEQLQQIQREYFNIQNQARVKLRRQQLRNSGK